MDTVYIQADDREKQSGMLNLLEHHPQVTLDIKRMRYGDYLVGGWLIKNFKLWGCGGWQSRCYS